MVKKKDSKPTTQQKRNRRRILSFFRVIRYGTDSFIRNSWLSVAATAVMTITLLIIFTAFVAQNILTDTVGELRNKVDMSIYLKTETTDKVGNDLIAELKQLSSVRTVTYISAAQARKNIAEANKGDTGVLDAIKEATNKNPATLRVVISDINDTSQLEDFVANNTILKKNLSADYFGRFCNSKCKQYS